MNEKEELARRLAELLEPEPVPPSDESPVVAVCRAALAALESEVR